MSEQRATYKVEGAPHTREAFRNRECTLPFSSPNYRPPEPEEVKALVDFAGWTHRQVAAIVGIRHSASGATALRKWCQPKGDKEHREISYAAWRLMLLHAGIIDPDEELSGSAYLMTGENHD